MNDCISREEALKHSYIVYDDELERHNVVSVEDIEELPSAETEPNTGHWVSQRGGGYRCSECGRYALDEVDGNFIHVAFKSNFCPYCGADMRADRRLMHYKAESEEG